MAEFLFGIILGLLAVIGCLLWGLKQKWTWFTWFMAQLGWKPNVPVA